MSVIPIEQTLNYVNQARANPKNFAQYVQQDINSFVNDRQMPLMPNFFYSTNQGISAWKECYSFLMNAPSLPPYQFSDTLNLTAKDHAKDMEATGIQGHRGSDGSTLTDRIQRRCGDFDGGAWAENIGSQFNLEGRDHALKTVLGLIIDDGVPSRGHRKNIFSEEYQYIGIYSILQGDKIKTVMNFHSDDLQEGESDSEDGNNIQGNNNNNQGINPNNFNNQNNQFNQPIQPIQPGYFNQNNYPQWNPQQQWSNNNFGQGFNQQQGQPKKPKKNKKVPIGSSMQQQTEYVNGKMVVRTIQTIRYSDGSVQENETIEER